MSPKQQRHLIRIAISAVLFILGILILEPTWVNVDVSRFVEGPRLEQTLAERNPGSGEQRGAWERLLAATRDPQGIELVPLSEYARIPSSGPID